jgi:hypothetical protein
MKKSIFLFSFLVIQNIFATTKFENVGEEECKFIVTMHFYQNSDLQDHIENVQDSWEHRYPFSKNAQDRSRLYYRIEEHLSTKMQCQKKAKEICAITKSGVISKRTVKLFMNFPKQKLNPIGTYECSEKKKMVFNKTVELTEHEKHILNH